MKFYRLASGFPTKSGSLLPTKRGRELPTLTLAEKLETIITRTTTNTRMRDFYDIYILEQLHGTTLNPKILHDALLATAHKRGSEKYLNQAEEVFDEVENDSVMQKLWEAYRKKFSYASDLEWDVIMKAIRRLYVLCEKGISL